MPAIISEIAGMARSYGRNDDQSQKNLSGKNLDLLGDTRK